MIERVAIIGSGFAGTLLAVNLLRHEGPRAVLIERGGDAGRGVAYGAADATHVLNVRAANMSAFPDDPSHFVRWLEARGVADPAAAFVPRLLYGTYLEELLADARAATADRLTVVKGEVVDARPVGGGMAVDLSDGRTERADAVVLAVGNLPPHDPPGLGDASAPPGRYHRDPWSPDVGAGLAADDTVLLLGTGLTMVDVALALKAKGFAGRIVACSRRGLLPRAHAPSYAAERLDERPSGAASQLVRRVRGRARAVGWRNAVDELRPFTQAMWAAAGEAERSRFLRHLRPWWDVHRHRLAPAVAARLAAMQADGRLSVVAGRTLGFVARPDGVDVRWRPRGREEAERLCAQRIVNCTGPSGDLTRTREPLLRALLERGAIRPDAARLGIDVDRSAAAVGADGRPSGTVFAVGPMTRGAFWEIVAVPDIRGQSWTLARRLSNAHWVGGEGL